ncbi:MAG: tRNA dihydrouridine synthase DusB [Magnetococcales bacterium]|nr:tRNA dihydrouridine synthase DusB [Magnetococcales bacterium]
MTETKELTLPHPFGSLAGGRPLLALAPMAGITDLPFRLQARRYGADLLVSEMISSQAMVRNSLRTKRMASSEGVEAPLVVQIAGGDPQIMADAARMNVELGADAIDINMGCPVKKIVNTWAGAALMKDEELVGRILEAVTKAVQVPVTVKMRLGWDNNQLNGETIARIAQAAGVRWIAVHGRTRAQMYQGKADWQAIGRIKAAVSIPVIGNGDITTPQEAKHMLEISGVDGLMIGRGALGRPWLFQQVKHYLEHGESLPEPDVEERYQTVLFHLDHMLDHYGPRTGNLMARKHLSWYGRGIVGAARFREEVNHSPNGEITRQLASQFFRTASCSIAEMAL